MFSGMSRKNSEMPKEAENWLTRKWSEDLTTYPNEYVSRANLYYGSGYICIYKLFIVILQCKKI